MSYFLRKLGFYAVALWAALTLNFAIPRLLPGNPVDILLAKLQQRGGSVSPETRKAYTLLLGGDDTGSLWSQYLNYLKNLAHGDLGVSVSYYPAKVSDVILGSLPWTLVLVGVATVLAALLGVLLGAIVGWRPGTWLDSLVPATTLLAAIPYFWLALILTYLLARVLGWLPLQGGYDVALTPGWNTEFIRLGGAVRDPARPDHRPRVDRRLAARHAEHDGLHPGGGLRPDGGGQGPVAEQDPSAPTRRATPPLPSVAGFAISLGFVVSGSVITEQVFSYPGIGGRLLGAVTNNDYPLMQGVFLFITLAVLGANLIVDLLYGLIDPRTRARH